MVRRWIAVVLASLAAAGAAWASPWCDLSAAGSLISISVTPLVRFFSVSSSWTQTMNCDVGDSDPQVCTFCLRRVLFMQVAGAWQQLAVAGPAQGWIRCNRTWTAAPVVDDWGTNFQPGTYDLQTQIWQGGRCSKLISYKDLGFTVP
jgi:hypothetical protein